MTTSDVFRVLLGSGRDEALIVANGYLSRQAFACRDMRTNFYMLGSMGQALSIGLGVALAQPTRRVVVADGDGNLLMSLGALAMAGHIHPSNLMHIVIDNGQYASTGGQISISGAVRMSVLAQAAGYQIGIEVSDEIGLTQALEQIRTADGPSFVRVFVSAGADIPPRVTRSPEEIARTFRQSMAGDETPQCSHS